MTTALYAGSFDPMTRGHLDVIRRAAKMFDHLYVGVLINYVKTPMFTIEERVEMIREEVKDLPHVEVVSFDGLVIDAAKKLGVSVLVRGLRAVTDFEYEIQMALLNRNLDRELDTIFFATSLKYSYLSSSIVKEVASYDGDISRFVTPNVERRVKEKLEARKGNS